MTRLAGPSLAVLAASLFAAAAPAAQAEPAASAPVRTVAPAAASGPAIVDQPALFTADDLLLLEVDADGYQISDGMSTFTSRAGLFVPLGEFSRLFDLAIDIDAAHGRADGWVLEQSRSFHLDLAQHKARIGDKTVEVSAARAAVYDGDIYLRSDFVEALLPLKLKAELHDLVLIVTPTERMPFQQHLAREQQRSRLANGPAADEVMRVKTPYALFTPPALDADVTLGGGSKDPATVQYALRAAGDLAFTGFQLYANSDPNGRLSGVRVLLNRKDPQGRDVGLPGLTRAEAGDTFTPNLILGARSGGGRGVLVSSEPLQQASVFDKLNLRGDLPTGYEVELYVNEVLRGSTTGTGDGRYEFKDVELSFGLNTVRLVFYGPRGERREEVQRINVGAGSLAKGQFTFALGAVQDDVALLNIPVANLSVSPGSSPPSPPLTGTDRARVAGEMAYGLTRTTTLTAAFADYTPINRPTRQMASVGVSSSTAGFAVQGVAASDSRDGTALALGLAGRPEGVSIVLRHSEYFGDFIDETQVNATGDGTPLRRDTTLNLDYTAKFGSSLLPMSLRATEDGFADGGQRLDTTLHLSKPLGRYLLSSSIDYQAASGSGTDTHTMTGGFDVSGLVGGGWQLRGSMAYQGVPQTRLESLSFNAQRNFGQRLALQFAASKSFGPGAATIVTAGNTWKLRYMDVTLNGGWTSDRNDFRIGLQISTGLLFNPLRHRYQPAGPGAAAGGAMVIDAFVDADGDGKRGPMEKGVSGIAATGGRRDAVTDALGEAMMTGLGDGVPARVHLDTDKLDDPYLTGPPHAIEIVPRPGRVAVVPWPMASTSEIEIKAIIKRPGEAPRGLSALSLQLVSSSGAVSAQGRTEYDGTIVLENVKPGEYAVRIDPEQAKRLNLALKAPVTITAKPSGGFSGLVTVEIVVVGASASADAKR